MVAKGLVPVSVWQVHHALRPITENLIGAQYDFLPGIDHITDDDLAAYAKDGRAAFETAREGRQAARVMSKRFAPEAMDVDPTEQAPREASPDPTLGTARSGSIDTSPTEVAGGDGDGEDSAPRLVFHLSSVRMCWVRGCSPRPVAGGEEPEEPATEPGEDAKEEDETAVTVGSSSPTVFPVVPAAPRCPPTTPARCSRCRTNALPAPDPLSPSPKLFFLMQTLENMVVGRSFSLTSLRRSPTQALCMPRNLSVPRPANVRIVPVSQMCCKCFGWGCTSCFCR